MKIQKISSKVKSKLNEISKINKSLFYSGNNTRYVEQMYEAWNKDPNSVHISWKNYFEAQEKGQIKNVKISSSISNLTKSQTSFYDNDDSQIQLKILQLFRGYQKNGYLKATIDPLGLNDLQKKFKIFENKKDLDYNAFGFSDSDLDKEITMPSESFKRGLAKQLAGKKLKIRELISLLEKCYCGNIGIEFKHISNRDEVNFILDKMEIDWPNFKPSKDEKLDIFKRLLLASKFEQFCDIKFMTKRFGVEGLETLITGVQSFTENMSNLGYQDITLGMAHRGRLNVLANVCDKPIKKIFMEFMGKVADTQGLTYTRSGDVKYHLGYSSKKKMKNGNDMNIEILCNPSHLECVNPVVQGKVRAKQHFNNDEKALKYFGVLIHGDAAFSGQGVNYENMQMNNLENYTTGGLLHIIANNQIGFTTIPKDGRSTPYPTEIGKSYDSPIIHVNGDDPEAVEFAFKLAAEYSKKYPKDLIVDIIGYRRYGHNELDQPFFTQPEMYTKISKIKPIAEIYENKLISDGFNKDELEKIKKEFDENLTKNYEDAKKEDKIQIINNDPKWKDFTSDILRPEPKTGLKLSKLKEIGEKICNIPDSITPHPTIKKIYQARLDSIKNETGIDWATGEALAFSILIQEGKTVRLSGQDVERGTFSHRHSVVHDQKNFLTYRPIDTIAKNPKNLQICLSPLSEYAVLGFELGFSYYDPNTLVMWEAQFGDFANGAQVIVDQFISSGESKWNICSGLVLLLPHGMDGQGPEHSSCRIERYLELLDDHPEDFNYKESEKSIITTNIQVCNPTTPANYFHLLLRQIRRTFRKPLIIPTPKRLLRLKEAQSDLSEFDENRSFEKVRKENDKDVISNAKNVKVIIFCSGNVYYDLIAERKKLKIKNVAILTIEQIAPMPYIEIANALKDYQNVSEIKWVQEEHLNSGCWTYVQPRLNSVRF